MLIEEQASNLRQTLEEAWLTLQHTPPSVERYQRNPWLADAEGITLNLLFCSRGGFPADAPHQCPQEAA